MELRKQWMRGGAGLPPSSLLPYPTFHPLGSGSTLLPGRLWSAPYKGGIDLPEQALNRQAARLHEPGSPASFFSDRYSLSFTPKPFQCLGISAGEGLKHFRVS